ncbi:MAG: hypothetical protein BWY59_00073 [Verrucomicrobia bacterium ADurb.Bin345]|nr:MAG: hypothetical protein BWY59_00073 [Verrucomicrobia bacterium ADurb.Bin345]
MSWTNWFSTTHEAPTRFDHAAGTAGGVNRLPCSMMPNPSRIISDTMLPSLPYRTMTSSPAMFVNAHWRFVWPGTENRPLTRAWYPVLTTSLVSPITIPVSVPFVSAMNSSSPQRVTYKPCIGRRSACSRFVGVKSIGGIAGFTSPAFSSIAALSAARAMP